MAFINTLLLRIWVVSITFWVFTPYAPLKMILSQHKYSIDILPSMKMEEVKLIFTPVII